MRSPPACLLGPSYRRGSLTIRITTIATKQSQAFETPSTPRCSNMLPGHLVRCGTSSRAKRTHCLNRRFTKRTDRPLAHDDPNDPIARNASRTKRTHRTGRSVTKRNLPITPTSNHRTTFSTPPKRTKPRTKAHRSAQTRRTGPSQAPRRKAHQGAHREAHPAAHPSHRHRVRATGTSQAERTRIRGWSGSASRGSPELRGSRPRGDRSSGPPRGASGKAR